MTLWTRLFGAPKEEDYETILSNLANDIQKRQVKLSEIRLRERRTTLLVTLWTLAGWAAYVGAWYMALLPSFSGRGPNSKWERALESIPVLLGPLLILLIRRLMIWRYETKEAKEEKQLQALLKQQRAKVEEVKKKTNYYSTRDLLQKYDESNLPGSPARPPPGSSPQTPQRRPGQPGPSPAMTPMGLGGAPPSPALRSQLAGPPPMPTGPPRKQWYDKLADAILGEEGDSSGAASRYALICEKCFAHNGLVKESMYEDAQYLCPKCGHFNASRRAKKEGRANGAPAGKVMYPSPRPAASEGNLKQRSAREGELRHRGSGPELRQRGRGSMGGDERAPLNGRARLSASGEGSGEGEDSGEGEGDNMEVDS
ncbi:hypothetical protein BD626DRAFT_585796 [Schizophyllum amplum]|uniref:Endoplasmic reticulum junction formation protein lunapark n=1 Tax=Schizophyllum amplum TaxID=97359 RepID=A0A550C2U6_9AGAR|nr:hypothetical protein BD626DRAFT_585796 [Auriculariopsis ampla]